MDLQDSNEAMYIFQGIDFIDKGGNHIQNQAVGKYLFSPCQDEGRGFESPFPLQFLSSAFRQSKDSYGPHN